MDRSQTGSSQLRDTYTGSATGAGTGAASGPNASTTGSANSVSGQIELLKTDISGLAQAVAGLTRQKIGDTIDVAQDKGAQQADQLASAIRKEPVKSAAIAAGVGFLLGLVMLR